MEEWLGVVLGFGHSVSENLMDDPSRGPLHDHLKACMQLPRRGIRFSDAVFALTGFRVLPFDRKASADLELLGRLKTAAETAARDAARQGIATARPNEAGNAIEPFVEAALRSVGLKAARPQCRSGSGRSVGYPDLQVTEPGGRIVYLDCKTYSQETRNQTLRSFYLSLTDDPKITCDAMHLIFGFELKRVSEAGQNRFFPQKWSVWTLDELSLQIKYEFNASNRDLYAKQGLLSEESL